MISLRFYPLQRPCNSVARPVLQQKNLNSTRPSLWTAPSYGPQPHDFKLNRIFSNLIKPQTTARLSPAAITTIGPVDHTPFFYFMYASPYYAVMFKTIIAVLLIGSLAWLFQAIRPPPPRICGSPNGPSITGPRIKLRDGRHLAYKEHGVSKDIAKYKIVVVHGFGSCKHEAVIPTADAVQELGIYLVTFDRPGYGESDPDPKRTYRSIALDIEELADQLELGSKFYVIGISMGGQVVWGCLKYISHRLAGAALVAPVINYWWPGFPSNLSREAYYEQFPQDQWALRVAHYTPWLVHWWNTQKLFPPSSVVAGTPKFSRQDIEFLPKLGMLSMKEYVTQQGEYESFHRDMIVGFGKPEFDPMDLNNPFPNGEGSVHLWHGDEDGLVPITLQKYIAEKLPWIHYHEVPGAGHLLSYADDVREGILNSLLVGKT